MIDMATNFELGVDIGYSNVKIATRFNVHTFPSIVGNLEKFRFSANGHNRRVLLEPPAIVGEEAENVSTHSLREEGRDWIHGQTWYTLFVAALSEVMQTDGVVDVCVGLPVAFYDDHEQVTARLRREHTFQRQGLAPQTVTVRQVYSVPQPAGTLMDYYLDGGRIVNQAGALGFNGILDIGGKTVNYLTVSKLTEVPHRTKGRNLGVWKTITALRDYLNIKYHGLDNLRDNQLMAALINKAIFYDGETVNLTAFVEEQLNLLAQEIISEARQVWSAGKDLQSILLTGGGGLLLAPYLTAAYPRLHLVHEPVTANARGYCKYVRFMKEHS
jgi:plasmid segregation protein ParM